MWSDSELGLGGGVLRQRSSTGSGIPGTNVAMKSNLAMVIEFSEAAWREKQRLEIKVPGPSWKV